MEVKTEPDINTKKNAKLEDGIEIEIPFDLLHYLNTNDCNLQNVCRICLTVDDVMISLLDNKESAVLRMLSSFTSIQARPDDGLPLRICKLCKSQVEYCYDFKSKCEKSECTLRSILKEFATKEHIGRVELAENVIDEQNLEESTIKDESDTQEHEDMNDFTSDNEDRIIVQSTNKNKKKLHRKPGTDFSNYLGDVSTQKKSRKDNRKKSYDCILCPKLFLSGKQLNNHMKKHENSENKSYSCVQCKNTFISEHDLRLHSAVHDKGPTWKCNKCHKEFKAKSALKRHIKRHMELKRYTCDTCGKTFTEMFALRRHTRVHTGETVEKKHACHICDKRFSENKLLEVHIARHSGALPYVCWCGKSFPSARLLASHKLVHSDSKPYRCSFCDKRFRHESTRNIHHRTHTGEKPYVCSTCGKTFIQNSNLTLHMRTHTGEKPYVCDVCDRKYASGSSLKSHYRTHTGEKPYSCKICDKKFARMDFNAHMRCHTGERPFACSVCPKKFINATRLRDHRRMHSGEKPYECPKCLLKFTTKSNLVKHAKTHETKKTDKRAVVVVQKIDCENPIIVTEKYIITNSNDIADVDVEDNSKENGSDEPKEDELPLEVTEELVVQDDGVVKTDVVVVDNSQNNTEYESSDDNNDGVAYANSDVNSGDVNLVTVNKDVNIANIGSQGGITEGTTLKLYQVDQSVVQIHRSGDQVTISKITSKMTANF
ncbi:uncharacterized protein ACR2FA_001767 [Aphomia sociella]